ncbi:hypothetical protein A0O34_08330 [Chryseobacterium glaciei]|uniref:Uncharacterized protein n=1 Tax=Chryseobacterium glaciei TaxID=1685010 RepID=A0A172XUD7_9FLAO|nr:DUF3990 domain-containing protein [Chryseobacterium glaciei]ANF50526.1 hypothetical protein A0O34_08330 [Chryseobacterium glaciei]
MSLEILNNKGSGDLSDSKLLSENDIQSGIFRKESFFKKNTFDEISAFKDSPFGQYWEKRLPPWAVTDYGPSRVFHESNFSIIDLSKKFSAAPAKLYNSLTNENWDDIKFIVLANPDGQKVLKDYADPQKIPKDDEVYFFIESDDGKFDFGRIVRVKLGKNAILKIQLQFSFFNKTEKELADEFLKRPFEIKNGEQYDFFNQIKTETKYKPTNLTDLLVKAIKYDYNQKKFDDMSWFLLFLKGEEYVGLNLPKKLLEISQWMRTKKYEEEKYWNAFLVKDFTPAFLPNAFTPQNRKNLKESIKNKLKQQIENLNKYDKETGAVEKVFKEILNNVLLYLFDKFSSLLDDGLKKLEDILPEEEMFNEIYNLNAFLVGLWNGCIEFTAGIVDLIALLMMIAKDGAGFILTDALKEAFENLLNELVYNFEDFIKKLWKKFYIAVKEIPDWYLKKGGNQYYRYKELGELTPDIITLLVPALKAGKATKAAEEISLLKKVSKADQDLITDQKYLENYYQTLRKQSDDFSKKLEEKTLQKVTKEAFEKAQQELDKEISKNSLINLFHGTSPGAANSIKKDGIQLSANKPNLDFNSKGNGSFYTSFSLKETDKYNKYKFGRNGDPSEILKFTISEKDLLSLKVKKFDGPTEEWAEFVTNARKGDLIHDYDIVIGPKLKNPWDVLLGKEKPKAIKETQVAITSEKGAKLLTKYLDKN